MRRRLSDPELEGLRGEKGSLYRLAVRGPSGRAPTGYTGPVRLAVRGPNLLPAAETDRDKKLSSASALQYVFLEFHLCLLVFWILPWLQTVRLFGNWG